MTTTILIPGLLCDRFVWEPVLTRLRVEVADLSTQDNLTVMAQHLLARYPGPLNVAGHSMGARVAMEMARLAPARIGKLALLDTGSIPCAPTNRRNARRSSSWAMTRGCRPWRIAGCRRWSPRRASRTGR